MRNNVYVTFGNDLPHLRHDVPDPTPGKAAWYECFDFGSDPIRWVVLGWAGHEDDDDLECVESYDDFGADAAAALAKFASIVDPPLNHLSPQDPPNVSEES